MKTIKLFPDYILKDKRNIKGEEKDVYIVYFGDKRYSGFGSPPFDCRVGVEATINIDDTKPPYIDKKGNNWYNIVSPKQNYSYTDKGEPSDVETILSELKDIKSSLKRIEEKI